MSETLGGVLKSARKLRGLRARDVAAHLGISAAAVYQWESNGTAPSTDNLIRTAALLGIDPIAAQRGDLLETRPGRVEPPQIPPDVSLPPPGQEEVVALPRIGNRDVPVIGTGVGGDEADFRLNGQTIDYVARPPGIAHKKGVFAIYLQNNSMYPVLKHGDPAYVDPNRQPQPREDVVIELHGAEGEPGDAFVKRLVRRSASKIVVEQFNPPKEIEFATKDVRQVLRIIPWAELIAG